MMPPPDSWFAAVRTLRIHPSEHAATQAVAKSPLADRAAVCSLSFEGVWRALQTADPQAWLAPSTAALGLRGLLGGGNWAQVQGLQVALLELRTAGIGAAAVQAGIRQLPATERPAMADSLRPVVDLLAAYEGWLTTLAPGCAGDAADRQRQAIWRLLQNLRPQRWAALSEVEVLPGCDLFGARLDLLGAFAALGIRVRVQLAHSGASIKDAVAVPAASLSRAAAFAYADALALHVESRGHPALEVCFDDRAGTGPLKAWRRGLFTGPAPDAAAAAALAAAPPAVRLVQVSAGYAQGVAVVEAVRAAAAAGIPLQDIGVVVPQPEDVPLLQAACAAAGVPVRPAGGGALAAAACLPGLLAALDLRGEVVAKGRFADFWLAMGEPLEGVAPAEVVAQVDRLAGFWVRPAEARLPAAAQQALTAALLPLRQLPARAPLSVYLAPLREWLGRRLAALLAAPSTAAGVEAAAAMEIDALFALQDGLEGLRAAAARLTDGDGDGAAAPLWTVAEATGWLRAALLPTQPRRPASAPLGISLLSLEQAMGCTFSRLIWTGCGVEAFPRRPTYGTWLTERRRAQLQAVLGPRLLQRPAWGPATARDLWRWMELVAGCTGEVDIFVVRQHADEALGDNGWLAALLESVGGRLHTAPSAAAVARAALPASPAAWASRQRRLVGAARCDAGIAQLPAALLPAWRQHLESHIHSSSRLDGLGACAYRYFAAAGLGLAAPTEPSLGISPRERGSAIHAALHAVYAQLFMGERLAAARADPAAAQAAAAAWVRQRAPQLFAGVEGHPRLQAALVQDALDAVAVVLAADLAAEVPAQPLALEYVFDDRPSSAAPLLRLRIPLGDAASTQPLALQVRGSIDRVDRQGGVLRIIDYKSTLPRRSEGRHFQLGLYVAVGLRDLNGDASSVAAAWLQFKDARLKGVAALSGPAEQARHSLEDGLRGRLQGVWAGKLDPDPDPLDAALCAHCDFSGLCRFTAAGGAS